MRGSKTSTWVAGTVVACLLLSVAAWFLAISPKLQEAGQINADAQAVEDQNEVLADRVAVLADQFERIDEFRTELAGLRAQVPADDEMSAYLRTLDEAAARHSVTLVSTIPGAPVELMGDPATVAAGLGEAVAVPSAPDATTQLDQADTEGSAPEATPTPAEPAAPSSPVVSIPLTLTVIGSYQNVHALVDELQQSDGRLLLAPSISVVGQQEGEEGAGRPATTVGDVEATITAYLYAAPTDTAVAPVPDESGEEPAPEPLPVPDPGRNPLVPVS